MDNESTMLGLRDEPDEIKQFLKAIGTENESGNEKFH